MTRSENSLTFLTRDLRRRYLIRVKVEHEARLSLQIGPRPNV